MSDHTDEAGTDDEDVVENDAVDSDATDGELAASARSVLEYLVKAVVDSPDDVAVEIDDDGRRPSLNVTVGDGDMGRVIGKRGRVAQSIRTVTRAAAARDGLEVDIEFLD